MIWEGSGGAWPGRSYCSSLLDMVENGLIAAPDSYSYVNTFFECKEGISIGFLTILGLGVLTMWYILYTKITMGRRKRHAVSYWAELAEFATAFAYGGQCRRFPLTGLFRFVP